MKPTENSSVIGHAEAESAPHPEILVARNGITGGLRVVGVFDEGIHAKGEVVVEETRLGPAHRHALAAGDASLEFHLKILTRPHQVAFGVGYVADNAVGGRVACGEGKLACLLFLHIDRQDRAIRRRPFLLFDLHGLEEARSHNALLRLLHHHLVVGVALGDPEFAADDLVFRGVISGYIDPLDIFAWTLLNDEDDRNRPGIRIAVYPRADLSERLALLRGCRR